MTSNLTPDGLRGADALRTIRKNLVSIDRAVLRPEEMALLQDWHADCNDPDNCRELTRIIRHFA